MKCVAILSACLLSAQMFGQGLLINRFVNQTADAGGGAYTPNTVDFAGTNTGMTNRNVTTWPASANSFACSFWIKPDAAEAGTIDGICLKSDDGIRIFLTSGNKIRFDCEDAANTVLIITESTASIVRDGNTWTHIFYRIDRTTDNQATLYINGSLDTTGGSTFLSTGEDADPIDTDSALTYFAYVDDAPTLSYAGCMVDFWFDCPITYANIVVGDFISGGDPVDLGSTGQNPGGATPLIFLKGNGTGFNVNSGTLGNFTAQGTTLTTCNTGP